MLHLHQAVLNQCQVASLGLEQAAAILVPLFGSSFGRKAILEAQGPAISMVRRHARSASNFHYGPALQTVSGNYVSAKRKGIVNGVDYVYTGVVRSSPCVRPTGTASHPPGAAIKADTDTPALQRKVQADAEGISLCCGACRCGLCRWTPSSSSWTRGTSCC